MSVISSLVRRFQALMGAREGNVAVLFGLSILPAVGMVGLGIDFATANIAKRRLDAAADVVALNAVSRSTNPNLGQPTQDWARSTFNAAMGQVPNLMSSSVQLDTSNVQGNFQIAVSYQATLRSVFGNLFQVSSVNLRGVAKSVAPLPSYTNLYFLLDNSPSMGLAATQAGIAKMNAINNGCAFACHRHVGGTGPDTGHIVSDDPNDSYHLAKSAGVQLRIDLSRTSTQQVLNTALNLEGSDTRFQAAVYTFSDVLQSVAGLSTDLNLVKAQASNVDLAYAYLDSRNAQTDYATALSYMAPIVGSGGDGQTSGAPRKFVVVITDGVQDQPANSRSGSGDWPDQWAAPSSDTYPPRSSSPNKANSNQGNVSAGNYSRTISTIDPSQCDAIKSKNVSIVILYTKYLPVTTDDLYRSYVAQIIDQVPTRLQSCASPGLFFTVDPSQDIGSAMTSIFYTIATGQPRLVN